LNLPLSAARGEAGKNPRIGFLQAIFPDAKFIHIVRDGCAVANSRMNAPFWKGWQGLNTWGGQMPRALSAGMDLAGYPQGLP